MASSEYNAWVNMRQRCTNVRHPEYPRYGGRGITFDASWNSFSTFLSDMGEKTSSDLSLERLDNDLGYSKDNCEWQTKSRQSYNQRVSSDNKSGVIGVYKERQTGSWKAYIRVNGKQLTLGRFPDFLDAVASRKVAEAAYYEGIKK